MNGSLWTSHDIEYYTPILSVKYFPVISSKCIKYFKCDDDGLMCGVKRADICSESDAIFTLIIATMVPGPGPGLVTRCYWGWHGLTLCNEWETVHVISTKNLSHFYTSTFFIGLHSKWQLGNIKELDLRYYRCCHKTIDPLIMHLSLIPEYN